VQAIFSFDVGCLMFSLAVLKAFSISSAAVENAFSSSLPILANASFSSSVEIETPASMPFLVLALHFGQ